MILSGIYYTTSVSSNYVLVDTDSWYSPFFESDRRTLLCTRHKYFFVTDGRELSSTIATEEPPNHCIVRLGSRWSRWSISWSIFGNVSDWRRELSSTIATANNHSTGGLPNSIVFFVSTYTRPWDLSAGLRTGTKHFTHQCCWVQRYGAPQSVEASSEKLGVFRTHTRI